MKRKEKIGIWMICLIWVLVAGCSHSEDDAVVPVNKDVKTRLLTFTQVENRGSRAVLNEDAENGLKALWKRGDQLECCNLKLEESIMTLGGISTGTLTARDSNVVTSIFQGEMTCEQNDQLAVIYPATDFDYELKSGECFAKYTIILSEQDGTLEKLANSYHYMYGVATVNSVTNSTAEASGQMQSLLAVCKFSFTDGEGNPISVKKLEISYFNDGIWGNSQTNPHNDGSWSNSQTYPQRATVKFYDDGAYSFDPDASNDQAEVDGPLIIELKTAADAVYVALLPVTTRTFHFKVTDANDGTYTGKAMATLQAGEYVVASLPVKK